MLWFWQVTTIPLHTEAPALHPFFCQVCSVWAQDSASPSQNLVVVTSLTNSGETCPGAFSFQPLQKEHILLPGLISQYLPFVLLSTNLFFSTKYKAVTKQFPQCCLAIWFWFSGFLNFVLVFLILFFAKITNNTLKLFIFEKNMMRTYFLKISALYYFFKGINTVERSTIC